MQRLVDDLMSLSRIEMSEHVRPVEEWSLNQHRRRKRQRAAAGRAASTASPSRSTSSPEGARVLGDRDQLAQVFTNLIDNADEVRRRGRDRCASAPRRRARRTRAATASTVEDDGPGIPREHIHRLTERFYRVSVDPSRNKGGTGLGLAIVKHILNRHEGRLEITSTAGQGQRLHRLAAARRGRHRAGAEPEADAPLRPASDLPFGVTAPAPARQRPVAKLSRNRRLTLADGPYWPR